MGEKLQGILEWLTRKAAPPKPCVHRWGILIEHYPTFAKDRWQCRECGACETFEFGQPPTKLDMEVCSLGTMHIMNGLRPECGEDSDAPLDAEVIG